MGNMPLWHSWNSQNICLYKEVCWPCEHSCLVFGHSVPHINFLFCRKNAFGISHHFISPVKEINAFCFSLCTANKWRNNLHVVTVRLPYPNLLTRFHFGILQEDSTGQYRAYFTLNQSQRPIPRPSCYAPGYPFCRGLSELQIRTGGCGKEKNQFPLPETYPASSAVQPIAESLHWLRYPGPLEEAYIKLDYFFFSKMTHLLKNECTPQIKSHGGLKFEHQITFRCVL